jgi:hypothetical protein
MLAVQNQFVARAIFAVAGDDHDRAVESPSTWLRVFR